MILLPQTEVLSNIIRDYAWTSWHDLISPVFIFSFNPFNGGKIGLKQNSDKINFEIN